MDSLIETSKTKVKRGRDKASIDRKRLYQIIDQAHVVHVGFSVEGQSYVIPMLGWRVDNQLYIHGSNGRRMIKALCEGVRSCVTATLLDGMVLAKSAFHHSTNNRSAVVFGQFRQVTDLEEIERMLFHFMEHIAPGRWNEVRPPSEQELQAISILAIELEEASIKVRSGPAKETAGDETLSVWSGEMKIKQVVCSMKSDENIDVSLGTPDYSEGWQERWEVNDESVNEALREAAN